MAAPVSELEATVAESSGLEAAGVVERQGVAEGCDQRGEKGDDFGRAGAEARARPGGRRRGGR